MNTVVEQETGINRDEVPTPGSQLKAAREKAGLSVEEVATQLYVTEGKINALESDQYGKLPASTFVQGYLRKYAALLDMDGDHLLRCYNDYRQSLEDPVEHEVSPPSKVDHMVVGSRPPKWILPASLFCTAVLVLAAVIYFIGDDTAPAERSNPLRSETIEVAPELLPEPLEPQSEGSQPERVGDALAPELEVNESIPETVADSVSSATASSPPATVVDAVPVAQSSAGTTAADQLIFGFSDECWLEVSDASGGVIHAGLHNMGEPVVVSGQAPFSIMLGNARAASISLNGEEIDFDIRPGHRTAKFTVR